MPHRDQFIAMLEDAGINFGYSEGDSVIAENCRFRFYGNGRLKEIINEGDSDREQY